MGQERHTERAPHLARGFIVFWNFTALQFTDQLLRLLPLLFGNLAYFCFVSYFVL
jgi:hypothetical protein